MRTKLLLLLSVTSVIILLAFGILQKESNPKIISYIVDTQKARIEFYWKDSNGKLYLSIQNLKTQLEANGKKLKFAMNGGMYKPGNIPLGLYIENGKVVTPIDTNNGNGNFYLKPNGIFYLDKNNKSHIAETRKMLWVNEIKKFATQSGPMLLIDGKIHPAFSENSLNKQIRNGVGILPDGRTVFAISNQEINFYEFAQFFKDLGCKNALYLDGFVSRMYCPEKNIQQLDGDFGVIIAEWE